MSMLQTCIALCLLSWNMWQQRYAHISVHINLVLVAASLVPSITPAAAPLVDLDASDNGLHSHAESMCDMSEGAHACMQKLAWHAMSFSSYVPLWCHQH